MGGPVLGGTVTSEAQGVRFGGEGRAVPAAGSKLSLNPGDDPPRTTRPKRVAPHCPTPSVRRTVAIRTTIMSNTILTLGLSGLLLLTSQDSSSDDRTVLELASDSENFSTLVAAVDAAGLTEALSGESSLTVFAPTNEAFEALGSETLKGLLTEQGRPQLRRILLHHVVAGDVPADELVRKDRVETLAETSLSVKAALGRVFIGEAAIETADLAASNGMIHVIDRVLLPPVKSSAQEKLLSLTIQRGVALFNSGDYAACCAVYATALDALRLGDGFGLQAGERRAVQLLMGQAEAATGKRDLAWAYRRIIDTVLRGDLRGIAQEAAATPERGAIFSFSDLGEVRGWRTVLDGVMGGRSTGRIGQGDGSLVFDGKTSLQNNGGFASMRCALPDGALDGADTIQLRVKGDGRTYIFGARSSSRSGGDSYWYRFETVDGEWQTVDVKIDDLERHFFGQRMRGKIAPAKVRALEFYVYDKKAGPFRLEIDEIRAISSQESAALLGD